MVNVEEERKYDLDAGIGLPDLTGCLPAGGRVLARPAVTLRATYFDTADLRLARAGVSLRHRRGDPKPWTVKLPTPTVGIRHEISRPGPAGTIPDELVALLIAYHRGAPLQPSATLRTVRAVQQLRDADDQLLVEVCDDTVTVLDGRRTRASFREIEVERHAGRRRLLDRVGACLLDAGAVAGAFTAKHLRALGTAATEPPELPEPGTLPPRPRAGAVVTRALRAAIARIVEHDPLVRLREPLPGGDTPVHQMRVGCRRLRSDLRSFAPLLEPQWADPLRAELDWVAGVLGAARDAEVLRERLRATATADPLAPLDAAAVARMDADLAARHEEALQAVDDALRSPRYLALLEQLHSAARTPRLTAAARRSAQRVLPALVAAPWWQLVQGARDVRPAGRLNLGAPDEVWHAVRVRAKRARYAADAVASVIGGAAPGFARSLAGVQALLGEHQDAAVAAETWLAIARADPDDHALAVTAGRLFERERTAIRATRFAFPAVWSAATRRGLTDWLPR